MSVCEILSNLWLGNIVSAKNSRFFIENNINVVVNCSKDIPFYHNNTKNYRISIHDNLEEEEINKFYDYLNKIIPLIHDHLLNNDKILVHCYAGKQRSASIICCYLMKYGNMTLKQSIESIKSKRLIAFTPYINFKDALIKYETLINNSDK
jgi:protein-tyrosine phosphatase